MEPKPLITYFGDRDVLGTNLQKKLQSRLRALQLTALPKEDPSHSAFSAVCNGVEFMELTIFQAQCKGQLTLPIHRRAALHTFWTACCDLADYRKSESRLIKRWLEDVEKLGDRTECLIVYCITAEVRAKRQRAVPTMSGSIEERMRGEFRGKADDVIQLRMASSEESRVLESYQAFVTRVNQLCLGKLRRDIEKEAERVELQRGQRSEPKDFYSIFLQKVNLAVAYEMTLQHEDALQLYSEANTDLEEALSMYADSSTPPAWLELIRNAPCRKWDYPKLVWHHLAWKYLPLIERGTSPLLHTRTFLLVRVSHLLFALDRAWTVSELCINSLHCMAREITSLRLALPPGAFDCWAYMTCYEAVLAISTQISADSLLSASSCSLLLVRAELWNYALQKLHALGVLCGLMPSSNVLNYDDVLIKQITAGITAVPFEVGPREAMEDQGKALVEILRTRSSFQRAYLTLGEMVIGAFKHAGRRRMAFMVGTMMAQFHRDLGLVQEAEELLSDICRFYSEDRWAQLSTKAYSLLADCQYKLKMEDKHVNTMLLLTSLPPYPGAAHDPCHWLDSLMQVAHKSPYQKMLTWDPLLELVAILPRKEGSVGEKTQVEIVVRYHGPKEMKLFIVTLELRTTKPSRTLPESPLKNETTRTPTPTIQLSNLEELDLESDSPKLPHSRPIGHLAKVRSPSSAVTHISRSDIVEMASEGGETKRSLVPDVILLAKEVTLQPGENHIVVDGKVKTAGQYAPNKVSLKCGALDFLLTLPPHTPHTRTVTILPTSTDVEVSLGPELGVFLSGYPLSCSLSFTTTGDMVIPKGAGVRVVANDSLQWTIRDNEVFTKKDKVIGVTETAFKLPAVAPHSTHTLPLSLLLSSQTKTSDPRASSSSLVGGAESHDQSRDQSDQLVAYIWKHEVHVYCDWLSPVHVAKLPLSVYDPLTITHRELSAGESTFLQLVLQNTCPLPLALGTSTLAADVELTKLHSDLPEVLQCDRRYSCMWQVKSDASSPVTVEKVLATFSVHFRPLVEGKETSFQEFRYNFQLSSMQTLYEVRAFLEPLKEHSIVTAKRISILKYRIKNVSQRAADIKSQMPLVLGYEVSADSALWTFKDNPHGRMEAPRVGQSVQLALQVMPNQVGALPIPTLRLSHYCTRKETDTKTDAAKAQGAKGLTVPTEGTVPSPLTSAQVYDLTVGEMFNVTTFQLVIAAS